jgi:tetratricopeptide (TPR) repeat protein
MDATLVRRERLGRFVDLARVYRGWSRQELASRLGRDASKVVPESGNPKLDLVVALADALDWTVGDVAECVWADPRDAEEAEASYGELDDRALAAHRAGDWEGMVRVARQMLAASRTGAERAKALNRMSGGYDGQGRYVKSLECLREALACGPLPASLRTMLLVNLANAHSALWHVAEARAMACELVDRFAARPPETRVDRVAQAFALHVRGQCARRMIERDPDQREEHAQAARGDLERAGTLFTELAREYADDSYGGVANTCRGALVEVACALGERDPTEAVAQLTEGLGAVEDPQLAPPGDWLESYGWWSIYGCNIALRHLEDPAFHRAMAVFTNKAVEIADRLGNWTLRERAFTLEHLRRRRLQRTTGFEAEWVLDEEDVRTIAGTMGRFPSFRDTGWRILAEARIVDQS